MKALGNSEGIHRLKKGKVLDQILGKFSEGEDFLEQLLLKVEEFDHTLLWLDKTSKQLCQIELCKLKLKFVAKGEIGSQQLDCVQFPGFFIARVQQVDFLKNFTSALILENSQGKLKVIIPVYPLQNGKYIPYQEMSLQISREIDFSSLPYIAYDLGSSKQLPVLDPSQQNLPAVMQLVSIYLYTRQYECALDLIEETRLFYKRTIDQTTKSFLTHILDNADVKDKKDKHPHAVALRLKLYSWSIKLKIFDATREWQCKNLTQEILLYENIYYSLNRFQLAPNVINKLKKVVNFKFKLSADSPLFLKELNFYSISGCGALPLIRETMVERFHNKMPINPCYSLAAPGEEFILNFFHYYKMALDGSAKEKLLIKQILALKVQSNAVEIEILKVLLLGPFMHAQVLSLAQMIELFSLKEDKLFSSTLRTLYDELRKSGSSPYSNLEKVNLNSWLKDEAPNRYFIFNYVNVTSDHSTKILSSPNQMTWIKTFQPLFPIDFHFLNAAPLDLLNIHEGLLKTGSMDLSPEIAAAEEFLEWASNQAHQAQNNLAVQMQFQRLQKGATQCLDELQQQSSQILTLSKGASLIEKALGTYQEKITTLKKTLALKKKAILDQAQDLHGDPQIALEFWRGFRSHLDLKTLLVALGRSDLTVIRNGNPTLSEAEIKLLMEEVAAYALLKSDLQHLKRAQASLNEYLGFLKAGKNESLQTACQAYVTTASARRCYNPAARPQVLVFEILSNLLLREEQLNALDALTTLENETSWKLFEARTGFGKSKAIVPLWLLLVSSQVNSLVMMVVPAKLFDQQTAYLQKFFKESYRFFGSRIDFSRESPCTAKEIAAIEKELIEAEEMRRPVFMSDQTAHNLLILKPKEIAEKNSSADNYATLGAFLKLKQRVKERGALYIDEPHKVLNDAQESNYSIGMAHPFDQGRLSYGLKIYLELFNCLKGHYRVEFWEGAEETYGLLPLLTEEEYRIKILPTLLDKMVAGENLPEETLEYLKGTMNLDQQQCFEKLLSKQESVISTKTRILHDQLHHYLPQTLKKNSNEHYALVDVMGNRTSISMEDARNPKEGNEFVSPDQILNFTIQTNLKTPFPVEYVERYIEELAKQAAAEIDRGTEKLNETLPIENFYF